MVSPVVEYGDPGEYNEVPSRVLEGNDACTPSLLGCQLGYDGNTREEA